MAAEHAQANGSIAGALDHVLARARAAADGSLSAKPHLQRLSISQRLERKFGLGDQPQKRRALYKQLELLADRFPEEVERIISEAVVGAASAKHADRYFCKTVKMKLAAEGLRLQSDADCAW